MFTREVLEQLKAPALKEICRNYKLAMSGNKSDILERIVAHQEKLKQEKEAYEKILEYGAIKRDDEFERVITVFKQWSDENGFWPSKLAKSGVSYECVDINEIRAALADYDPYTSELRKDSMVPIPMNRLMAFIEMIFNQCDDWHIFDTTEAEREFDCDSEFNDRWMIEGMKKIYEETNTDTD